MKALRRYPRSCNDADACFCTMLCYLGLINVTTITSNSQVIQSESLIILLLGILATSLIFEMNLPSCQTSLLQIFLVLTGV